MRQELWFPDPTEREPQSPSPWAKSKVLGNNSRARVQLCLHLPHFMEEKPGLDRRHDWPRVLQARLVWDSSFIHSFILSFVHSAWIYQAPFVSSAMGLCHPTGSSKPFCNPIPQMKKLRPRRVTPLDIWHLGPLAQSQVGLGSEPGHGMWEGVLQGGPFSQPLCA